MQKLTAQWQQKITDLAQQYDVSTDAVLYLLQTINNNNNSTIAKFSHPELGSGQWMPDGMTTVEVNNDSNNSLTAKINGLCLELSHILPNEPVIYVPLSLQSQRQNQQQGSYSDSIIHEGNNVGTSSNWWPSDLGVPTMTGTQNNMRYAYFAEIKRLAMEIDGQVTIFDTLDHQISGISQQPGTNLSITFTSQDGTMDLLNLPVISTDMDTELNVAPINMNPSDLTIEEISIDDDTNTNITSVQDNLSQDNSSLTQPLASQQMGILMTIEKLAELRQKDILTEEDFLEKKHQLLSRL